MYEKYILELCRPAMMLLTEPHEDDECTLNLFRRIARIVIRYNIEKL